MATLGHNDLKNRTFSIFQTASSQGFPVNLPWLKYISMAKTSDGNARQKRQCKSAFSQQFFCPSNASSAIFMADESKYILDNFVFWAEHHEKVRICFFALNFLHFCFSFSLLFKLHIRSIIRNLKNAELAFDYSAWPVDLDPK